MVYEFPRPYQIPATGVIEYQKVIVPSGFTEDKWVQFAEARPDDRAHVHHMILYVREPGSHWLRDQPRGVFFVAPKVTDDSTDTSALPSEGKSFTSANYSLSLAQQGHRVLLIDGDLRRPSLHKIFRQFGPDGDQTSKTAAEEYGIKGKAVTPYILARIVELSGGRSLRTNIALAQSNARLAAEIAAAMHS